MIGLGFSKKQAVSYPDSDVGMLDVAANALAVLILATMLVLTVAAPPAPRGEVRSSDKPELFYPSPLDVAVPPQSVYWIVTEGGLTPLDLDGFATGLSDGSPVARTAQGEATLIIDRRNYRDLNDHRLQINLDWAAITGSAISLATPQDAAIASDDIRQRFEQGGIVPSFVVTAAGTEAFSIIYWNLRRDQVPMRWVPIVMQTPLVLSRRVDNFETRARQWQ